MNATKWKCTVCGRVGSVGRCCGEDTREPAAQSDTFRSPSQSNDPIIGCELCGKNHYPAYPCELITRLERERDEAREELTRTGHGLTLAERELVGVTEERDEAMEKLADWENAAAHVEADHPDERHCGCVPVLRKLLIDARKERDEARRERDKAIERENENQVVKDSLTTESQSKTPLTDLLTGYEVSLFGGESEKYVRLKDCREIEERLNLCVEALEKAEPALWILAYSGNPDAVARHEQLRAAIAGARGAL